MTKRRTQADLRRYVLLRSHWIVIPFMVLALYWDCRIPQDPKQTLHHVRSGTMKVGISDAPPWSRMSENGQPDGIEAQLIQKFAAEMNSKVEWVTGSQHELLEKLSTFDLDVVVGGLTKTSPWKSHVSFTQPFAVLRDSLDYKKKHEHVMAVPPGENGFLLTLDRFLQSRKSDIAQAVPGFEP